MLKVEPLEPIDFLDIKELLPKAPIDEILQDIKGANEWDISDVLYAISELFDFNSDHSFSELIEFGAYVAKRIPAGNNWIKFSAFGVTFYKECTQSNIEEAERIIGQLAIIAYGIRPWTLDL
jgi:hypothetical protein